MTIAMNRKTIVVYETNRTTHNVDTCLMMRPVILIFGDVCYEDGGDFW